MTPGSIDWTGNPIVDVGLAAVCAMTGVGEPSQLQVADFDEATAELEAAYGSGSMGAYLTCLYPNAGYVNPTMGEERRRQYYQQVLHAYRLVASGGACGLCGRPAVFPANRQHVPLLAGEGVMNFLPAGEPSLPVCGMCLTAAQAFAFGAVRCQGRALALHSDDPEITKTFAARAVEWNRQAVVAAQASSEKYPSVPNPHRYIVEWVTEAMRGVADRPASATVYHLSNSGQGPSLAITYLPSQVFGFLRMVRLDTYRGAWDALVAQGANAKRPERNAVFDEVFTWPAGARGFVGRLRRLSASYRFAWALTELFAKEVMVMDKERIDAVRDLGDRLAGEIVATNDHSAYRRLYGASRYDELRGELIKLDHRAAGRGRPLPVAFDPFVLAFLAPDGVAFDDWRLARDLVVIRMIEKLAEQGFFTGQDAGLGQDAGEEAVSEEGEE